VNAAVIKFNSLTDAIRAATENHHLLRRVAFHFVVAAIVGGIIIWRVSFELGGAGVHEAVARHEADSFALGADGVFGGAGQMGDLPVGKSERLGLGEFFSVERWHRAKLNSQ